MEEKPRLGLMGEPKGDGFQVDYLLIKKSGLVS